MQYNDENDEKTLESGKYFKEIQDSPQTRLISIDVTSKGFPDIMNYWGINGTCVVSSKFKALVKTYFKGLSIQFLPCYCKQFPDVEMWLLNVCEYHDVLDLEKGIYKKSRNIKGEEAILSIKKYAFIKEAFDLDIFKIYINGNKHYVNLYVSDRFKAIMEENGVTGLALEKVYSI